MKTPAIVLKATAKLLAYLMYKPSGPVRPSKKTVIERTIRDTGFDLDGFNTWATEHIDEVNGDYHIPAEFHPVDNAKGVAILAHGFGQNRYVLIPQAEIFRELGYSVLMFDQRHFGESKAANGTFSIKEATDLIALAEWTKRRCGDETRIVVLGVSMGAMTVMNAISQTDLIDAAIEDCGPARLSDVFTTFFEATMGVSNPYFGDAVRKTAAKYGLSADKTCPAESVAKSNVPLLVIHSEGDSTVPVSCADEILKASKNPLSRREIFGDYEHAFSVNERDRYKRAVEDFLNDVFNKAD